MKDPSPALLQIQAIISLAKKTKQKNFTLPFLTLLIIFVQSLECSKTRLLAAENTTNCACVVHKIHIFLSKSV